ERHPSRRREEGRPDRRAVYRGDRVLGADAIVSQNWACPGETRSRAGRAEMSTRSLLAALVIGVALLWLSGPTAAETVGDVFRMVNPSVVVIRAKGRDVE